MDHRGVQYDSDSSWFGQPAARKRRTVATDDGWRIMRLFRISIRFLTGGQRRGFARADSSTRTG